MKTLLIRAEDKKSIDKSSINTYPPPLGQCCEYGDGTATVCPHVRRIPQPDMSPTVDTADVNAGLQ